MKPTSVPRTMTMTEDDMKRVISGISSSRAHEDPSACIAALSPLIGKAEGRRFLSKQVGEKALILIELFDWAMKSYGNSLNSIRGYMLWTLRLLCASQETLPQSCTLPIEFKSTDPHHAAGGFADVWKGTYDGRDVAFKTLRSCAQADDATRLRLKRRFCKEVTLWKSLNHRNILGLVGVCRWDNTPDARLTMVSEWMSNGNIIEYIKHNESYRMQLLIDSARGVQYLHRMNLVHGDLKGANILITSHNPVRACLADFGFMTIVYDADGPKSTTAQGGGTTPFMAPELLCPSNFGKTKCQMSKEADVYAFGIVVLQVLTGVTPFHPLRDPEIAYKVIQGERPPMPPNAKDLGISDKLWQLLTRCWHADLTQRPQIDEILHHLCNDPARDLAFCPSSIGATPGCESVMSNTQKYRDMFFTASNQTPIEDYPPFSIPMSPVDSIGYSSNEIGNPASLFSSPQTQIISLATSPGNSQIMTEDPKPSEPDTPSRTISDINDSTTIVADSTDGLGGSGRAREQGRVPDPLHGALPPSKHDPIIYDTSHVGLTQVPAQTILRPPPRSDPPGVKPRLHITTCAPVEQRHSDSSGTAFCTTCGSCEVADRMPFDSAVPVRVIYSRSRSHSGDGDNPFCRVINVQQQQNHMHQFPTQPTPVSPNHVLLGPPRVILGANASTTADLEPRPRLKSRLTIPNEWRDVGTSNGATSVFPQPNGKREVPSCNSGKGKEGDDCSCRSASADYVSVLSGGEGEDHSQDNTSIAPSYSNSSLFRQLLTKFTVHKYPQPQNRVLIQAQESKSVPAPMAMVESTGTPTVDSGRDRERTLSRVPSLRSLLSGSARMKRKGSGRGISDRWHHLSKQVFDPNGS